MARCSQERRETDSSWNPSLFLSSLRPAACSPFGCFGNLVIAVICVVCILARILGAGILRAVRRILAGIVGIVRIICVVCIAAVVCIVCHNCFLLRFFIGFTPLLWLLCIKLFYQFFPYYNMIIVETRYVSPTQSK